MGAIYDKSGDHLIMCAVREAHVRPFQATDWTDLRVGFFLSLTRSGSDDDPTSLGEVITGPQLPWTDRVQIGVSDIGTGSTFLGYTNLAGNRLISIGSSDLVTSDVGIGTTNAFYWRPKSGANGGNNHTLRIIDGGQSRASAGDGSQPHFIQADPGAGQYCTFFGLRFTRPDARGRANIITMQVKKTAGGHSSDILFTNTPTNAVGEAALESFPSTMQTLGPVEMSHPPDTFYFYWPFHNSRLRIHEVCILKAG